MRGRRSLALGEVIVEAYSLRSGGGFADGEVAFQVLPAFVVFVLDDFGFDGEAGGADD